jgi:acetyl esterase/lipase
MTSAVRGPVLLLALLGAGLLPVPADAAQTKDAGSEGPKPEPLWPDGAPGALGTKPQDVPTLTAYLPDPAKATGAAVVICPGGGYGTLAMNHEGHDVAHWLNSIGVAGLLLKYRHAPYRHPVPLQDAQRALRTARHRAKEWHLDPQRVGILGFSAGGHLASTAGTHFDAGKPDAADPIERQSCRPDFMVLVYPVISFTTKFAHTGSRNNLLGKEPSPELVKSLSNETQVTPQTPPTFLVHTSEDRGVPPENSVLFYLALREAKVPAEMHIFEKGPHGFGLAPKDPVLSEWPRLCAAWLGKRGLLKKD